MPTTYQSDLERVSKLYRQRLKELDSAVLNDLARAYGKVYEVAAKEMKQLADDILTANLMGEPVTPGWLYRHGRLEEIQRQLGKQLDQFIKDAGTALEQAQAQAMRDALAYAQRIAEASVSVPAGGSLGAFWANVAPNVLQMMLANTAPGGPVHKILQTISPAGATGARDALVNGIAQGYNPNKVARVLRQELGAPLARMQTIARTEIARVQNEATLEAYRANSEIVNGWLWSAADDDNTCEECWALDGSWFPIEDDMAPHINCRCTMVPELNPMTDLGFGEEAAAGYEDMGDLDPEGIAPELVKNGADIDENGYVTIYHYTNAEARDAIERTGLLINPIRPLGAPMNYEQGVYWVTARNPGLERKYGSAVVTAKVPLDQLKLDPIPLGFPIKGTQVYIPIRPGTEFNIAPFLTSGPARFARLSDSQQLRILGPAKYRAYKDGAVNLRDFIGYKISPTWGRTGYAKSLKEILGPERARKYYKLTPQERALKQAAREKQAQALKRARQKAVEAKRIPIFDTAILKDEKAIKAVSTAENALQKVLNVHRPSTIELLPESDLATARSLPNGNIAVTPYFSDSPSAIVHEYGHLLDRSVLGKEAEWFTQTQESDTLYQLFKKTNTYKRIRNDEIEVLKGDISMRNQFLQGREMFARAWEQYIAIRSKDVTLLAKLEHIRNDKFLSFQYWPDAEFEPIAKEFDRILSSRNLLKDLR